MKPLLSLALMLSVLHVQAQKIEGIKADLYTDSLKKGTYNYINIDGKLSTGNYIPLDTSDIQFSSTGGKFFGNSLWIEPDFAKESITIKAILKSDSAMYKEFTIYLKKNRDDEKLRTESEIMNEKGNKAPQPLHRK